jgi:hypothetical protein
MSSRSSEGSSEPPGPPAAPGGAGPETAGEGAPAAVAPPEARKPRRFRRPLRPWSRREGAPSYRLTRWAILRLLGFVYLVAFLSLANQVLPLIGKNGLLPAESYLRQIEGELGSRSHGFLGLPSLFWLDCSDRSLQTLAWAGVLLSIPVVLGFSNAILMALLWALYLSFVQVGQIWYGYGWESQLLETGFLSIFLCPLLDARPFPPRPPPAVVIWLFRWLSFRIMLGAGLIKMRHDPCWRDLTCLYHHYETQPLPNPLSRLLHFMPRWFHRLEVLWNHFIELVAVWFGFGPRPFRHAAGLLLVSFQAILILSGNLSFLNWLTIVPMLAFFDDSLLRRFLPRALVRRSQGETGQSRPGLPHTIAAAGLAALVAWLSIDPVLNLLSSGQAMNTSYNRFHLVNSYGAFGSVSRERREIVFEGTADAAITEETRWKEYQFKAKPGDPFRRPAMVSPYHHRLDWQIWFAAMSSPRSHPWTLHFVWKLLQGDPGTLGLLDGNPFPDAPPRFIRAGLYRYQFAPLGDPSGAWWRRTRIGSWLPPLSLEDPDLRRALSFMGWLREEPAGR